MFADGLNEAAGVAEVVPPSNGGAFPVGTQAAAQAAHVVHAAHAAGHEGMKVQGANNRTRAREKSAFTRSLYHT